MSKTSKVRVLQVLLTYNHNVTFTIRYFNVCLTNKAPLIKFIQTSVYIRTYLCVIMTTDASIDTDASTDVTLEDYGQSPY